MKKAFTTLALILAACGSAEQSRIEQAVAYSLADPGSAQFREVRRCTGDTAIWSGQVNAKNLYGAYVGFEPFLYSRGTVARAGDSEFTGLLDRCYSDTSPVPPKPSPTRAPAATAPAASPSKPKAEASQTKEVAIDPSEGMERPGHPNLISEERCWMDYCPCDRSDPDFGGADKFICDRMRKGLPVDDELLSTSSGMRDARRQLREFERDN